MAKDSGRFDLEDAGWEKPEEEDPLTKLLIRSSKEVQNGAIYGFFAGLLVVAISVVLALTVSQGFWLLALVSLFIGLIVGAITGKVIEIRRTLRRRARRAKLEEKEEKRKKKGPREAIDDDYLG
jgi:pilus assembly protein TadC